MAETVGGMPHQACLVGHDDAGRVNSLAMQHSLTQHV